MPEQFVNGGLTTLSSGITSTATSLTVTSASSFPSLTPFRIRVKAEGANSSELMMVTAGAGTTTWTVVRAVEPYGGSAAASAHGSGAVVEQVVTVVGLSAVAGSATPFTIYPTSDTYISDASWGAGFNTTNYDTATTLKVADSWGGTDWSQYALMTFDISTVTSVASAILRLYRLNDGNNAGTTTNNFGVRKILRAYNPTQVTWVVYSTGNNWTTAGAVGVGTDVSATSYGKTSWYAGNGYDTWLDIDITSLVAECLVLGETTMRLIIGTDVATTGQNPFEFASLENATPSRKPHLVITQGGTATRVTSDLDVSPNPTVNDDEFKTTDTSDPMTGWTTLGAPTAHDINSTVASHYYIKRNSAGSLSWSGIYKAVPSFPFTVTAKLSDSKNQANYASVSLFVGTSTPGAMEAMCFGYDSGFDRLGIFNYSNPTTYNSTVTASFDVNGPPVYLRVTANSATSIDWFYSVNGLAWRQLTSARNPGFTIGSLGLGASGNAADGWGMFDWIRFGSDVVTPDVKVWQGVTVTGADLETQTTTLGADVGLSGTFADIMSLSLSAGTWLVFSQIQAESTSGAGNAAAQLTNGTTVWDAMDISLASGYSGPMTMTTKLVLGTTTTVKVQAKNNAGTIKIAKTGVTAGGNVASNMTAIKVSGVSTSDPVLAAFGVPATAFEFDSTSLTGLTALTNAATTVNAHTTVPGHYFIKAPAAGVAGHYAAIPGAYPWTAITKISDYNARGNYNEAGIFVGVATPGSLRTLGIGYGTLQGIQTEQWTNPTTYSSSPQSMSRDAGLMPMWFAIRANSNTSVDFLVSYNGRTWFALASAVNLGITIGSVGIFGKSDGSNVSVAFDFLRIYTSALTFAGE